MVASAGNMVASAGNMVASAGNVVASVVVSSYVIACKPETANGWLEGSFGR